MRFMKTLSAIAVIACLSVTTEASATAEHITCDMLKTTADLKTVLASKLLYDWKPVSTIDDCKQYPSKKGKRNNIGMILYVTAGGGVQPKRLCVIAKFNGHIESGHVKPEHVTVTQYHCGDNPQ